MNLYSVLGCKEMSVKSPNFTDATFKAIHLTSGHSVEYEMPGKMAKYFNYDQRYKESERILKIELSESLKCQQNTWQNAYEFDGATWEYAAGKSQGLNGETGNIVYWLLYGRYTSLYYAGV